jgi:hypothetical protein
MTPDGSGMEGHPATHTTSHMLTAVNLGAALASRVSLCMKAMGVRPKRRLVDRANRGDHGPSPAHDRHRRADPPLEDLEALLGPLN